MFNYLYLNYRSNSLTDKTKISPCSDRYLVGIIHGLGDSICLVSSLFNKVFKTHFVKKNYLAFANMQRVSKSADYLKMTD